MLLSEFLDYKLNDIKSDPILLTEYSKLTKQCSDVYSTIVGPLVGAAGCTANRYLTVELETAPSLFKA